MEKEEMKHQQKLEAKKERYQNMKYNDKDKYEQYLSYLKEYRKVKKVQKENYLKKYLNEILEGEKYGVIYAGKKNKQYYITDKAIVFNHLGRKLKARKYSNGYKRVSIAGKEIYLHRLVWTAFYGEIPNGFEIDHIIPLKNGGTDELSNLRLSTHKENCNNEISIKNYSEHNKKVCRDYLKKNV